MSWKISQHANTSRVLITIFLVFLLTACGSNSSNANYSQTPTDCWANSSDANNPPATSVPTDEAAALSLNKAPLCIDTSNLHIFSNRGILCPDSYPPAYLVLTTERLTYSQTEIDEMAAYVSKYRYGGPSSRDGIQPPSGLSWVLGASSAPIPGDPYSIPGKCGGWLEITNTGNTPVQIPNINARLVATPQQNTYHYRLIDACSLLPIPEGATSSNGWWCAGPIGNDPGCSAYTAHIRLGTGEKDAAFSAKPTAADPSCGVFTIAPKAQGHLLINFTLMPSTPKNLVYSLTPELTLYTASGRQVISLSQLTSTLPFANASQFSCYQLQGTTFVLMQASTYNGTTVWCM